MAGLVPATHEHRVQNGAACRATLLCIAVGRAVRGAASWAMEMRSSWVAGTRPHKAGHDEYF
jgi:hypothetical protein